MLFDTRSYAYADKARMERKQTVADTQTCNSSNSLPWLCTCTWHKDEAGLPTKMLVCLSTPNNSVMTDISCWHVLFHYEEDRISYWALHNRVLLVRYVSDYLHVLPLGVLTRMVARNDTLMALLPLLEDPPWVRRRGSKTEKFIGNVWKAVEPRDRLRLTQQDAQVHYPLELPP